MTSGDLGSAGGARPADVTLAFAIPTDAGAKTFDSTVYETSSKAERLAIERELFATVRRHCLRGRPAELLELIAAVGQGGSALHRRAALQILRALLAEDPKAYEKGRLALLVMIVGLLDINQGKVSILSDFLLCLAGLDRRSYPTPRDLVQAVAAELAGGIGLLDRLSPATMVAIAAICRAVAPKLLLNPRLSEMRTPDRAGYRDVSVPLVLRLVSFLFRALPDETVFQSDLIRAAVAAAIAHGRRHPEGRASELIGRAEALSQRLPVVGRLALFEDQALSVPVGERLLFRRVEPAPSVEVALASDGSEVIGYVRNPITGDVQSIERDRLTAPLRGSRNRRRWNNEPVLRTRLRDATVTPNGLVLFGRESILDFEFTNLPNRSGSPLDRYQLGSYRELYVSGDRSAAIERFPAVDVDSGILLSGMPNMDSFGHFILTGASKFPLLRGPMQEGWTAIVTAARARFHDAIITYCGLDPSGFLFTGGTTGVRARQLDVLSEAPTGMWPYNLLDALRAEIPKADTSGRPKRIYLARPNGLRRSLANEEALLTILRNFDISVIRPELLPFDEQVATLEAADVIVAPHGSALTTLVFCRGRKRIVEVETKTSFRMSLYAFLGHDAVRVPSAPPSVRIGTDVDGLAYEVDLEIATRAVEWAIAR